MHLFHKWHLALNAILELPLFYSIMWSDSMMHRYLKVCFIIHSYSPVTCSWTPKFLVNNAVMNIHLVHLFTFMCEESFTRARPSEDRQIHVLDIAIMPLRKVVATYIPIITAWNSYCPASQPKPCFCQLIPMSWRPPIYNSKFRCLDIFTWRLPH